MSWKFQQNLHEAKRGGHTWRNDKLSVEGQAAEEPNVCRLVIFIPIRAPRQLPATCRFELRSK